MNFEFDMIKKNTPSQNIYQPIQFFFSRYYEKTWDIEKKKK